MRFNASVVALVGPEGSQSEVLYDTVSASSEKLGFLVANSLEEWAGAVDTIDDRRQIDGDWPVTFEINITVVEGGFDY